MSGPVAAPQGQSLPGTGCGRMVRGMDESLEQWRGAVAVVTGASSGIGRAVAEDFGRLGLRVVLVGRRREELEATAARVRAAGGAALAVPGDLAEPDAARRIFTETRAAWGGVDVLVNSAGLRGGASLLKADPAVMRAAFAVNVLAALECMREAATDLRGKTRGAIINISSMTGHRLLPGTPGLYAATKHALRIVTDAFRAELAAEKSPVKVALLSPGLVDTPWHRDAEGVLATKGAYPYEPLQPADIVAAVRYVLAAPPHVQIGDIQLRSVGQPF